MENIKIFKLPYKKGRWLFIPLGIILFMSLGTIYSWSVFRKPLENLFNITATQSGLPYMFFLASYATLMPISGFFIEKYKPNRIIIFGGILFGSGWILSSYANNITILTLTYGIIAGSGVGVIYGVPVSVISKWFPDKQGLAVGLILSGFGLSPLITAPLARKLIDLYGSLETFKVLGILFLIIIFILAIPFKFPEKNLSDKNQSLNRNNSKVKVLDISTKKMLTQSKFYGVWICYAIGTLIGLMTVGITSSVGEEIIKLTPKTTAFMVSSFAIFNGLGRPIFGWLTNKLSPYRASLISYIMVIISSSLMLMAKEGSVAIYIISFSLFWMTLGSWLAIAPTATLMFFGPKYYSKNYGFIFTAYGVGAILGVYKSGLFRDIFGSYLYTFYPLILLALIGILISNRFLKDHN